MNAPDLLNLEVNPDAVFEFRPDWGKYQRDIWELYAGVELQEGFETVSAMLRKTISRNESSSDNARQVFSLSLLKDILDCMGSIWCRDGKIFIAWPDWKGDSGRKAAQIAMQRSRELRPLNNDELNRVTPFFLNDIDGASLVRIIKEGHFSLVKASEIHPSGIPYSEAFSAALRYWSMPYRGRTGRSRRFLLTCTHALTNNIPVIAGILEMGDEAPFCSWRDDLLGITTEKLLNWIESSPNPREKIISVSETFKAYRDALIPTSDGIDFSTLSALNICNQKSEFESRAAGRSLDLGAEDLVNLKDQKRLTYALRLARGEIALNNALEMPLKSVVKELSHGVRAIHDIVLPRLHMEVSICGAIPPFSEALGGKLMVNFFSHPYILSSPSESLGTLLSWSFDEKKLKNLVPNYGLLAVTTKGLYAGHSSIYN